LRAAPVEESGLAEPTIPGLPWVRLSQVPSASPPAAPGLGRYAFPALAKHPTPSTFAFVSPKENIPLGRGPCCRAGADAGDSSEILSDHRPLSQPIREAALVLGRSDLASAFLPMDLSFSTSASVHLFFLRIALLVRGKSRQDPLKLRGLREVHAGQCGVVRLTTEGPSWRLEVPKLRPSARSEEYVPVRRQQRRFFEKQQAARWRPSPYSPCRTISLLPYCVGGAQANRRHNPPQSQARAARRLGAEPEHRPYAIGCRFHFRCQHHRCHYHCRGRPMQATTQKLREQQTRILFSWDRFPYK
jgi:hypothetical protein